MGRDERSKGGDMSWVRRKGPVVVGEDVLRGRDGNECQR
jgi:hypothetical protein